MVRYDTARYCMVRYGDVWIIKGNLITLLIISFELSENCSKIRLLDVMMRTGELGNTC